MYSKILISGIIEVVTGLHIGTGGEFSAIGAADSPVIREAVSGFPMIPGSSIKGKLRSLLAKRYNMEFAKTPDDDTPEIVALFGGKKQPSRLAFSDMVMCNMDELKNMGIYDPTEIKFENTISRTTGIANPRQIERVIRQSKFELRIIYTSDDNADIEADIRLLAEGMKLLQYDYLGGHGSRGYGRIKFSELSAETVIGNDDGELDDVVERCSEILKEVQSDEL